MPNNRLLSVQNLYNLDDSDVKKTINETFLTQLKNSPSVKDVFFSQELPPATPASNIGFVDNVAITMVCSSISRSSLFNFAKCIDQAYADYYWQALLVTQNAIDAGQNLYDWAFPKYCQAENHDFGEYLNDQDPHAWADQLVTHVTSPQFITNEMLRLIAGQSDWLAHLNLILYKIHRLHDARVAEVVAAWSNAQRDKGIVQNWQTYNFIPVTNFRVDEFLSEVNVAINQRRSETISSGFHGGPAGESRSHYVNYYGEKVGQFISQVNTNLANNYQRYNLPAGQGDKSIVIGNKFDNAKEDEGSHCLLGNTQIYIVDGSHSLSINEISSESQILSPDNIHSFYTNGKTKYTLKKDTTIYGFNDEKPFFTEGHPFWTDQGWKAINPKIAIRENPLFNVSRLMVGDTVCRMVDGSSYNVKINSFTKGFLKAGESIFSLRIAHGPESFYANGYAVGINYPILSEKRLQEMVNLLDRRDAQLLSVQLKPLLPLFHSAFGEFIGASAEEFLRNLLRQSSRETPAVASIREEQSANNISPLTMELLLSHTKVSTCSNGQLPISDVKSNELIFTHTHQAIDVGEVVQVTPPNNTRIYGINEEPPFFTESYRFLTPTGWKAIDPKAVRIIAPNVNVGTLLPGDMVYRATANPLHCEVVKIDKITSRFLEASDIVYSLQLGEGPQAYYANGYVAKVNSPLITARNLVKGLSRLSFWEAQALRKQVTLSLPLLKKAFGGFIEHPLQQALTKTEVNHRLILNKPKKNLGFSLYSINRNYDIKIYDHANCFYGENNKLKNLTLHQGTLTLDGKIIQKAILNHKEKRISWTQQTENEFSAGILHFTHDMLACTGQIYVGPSPQQAVCHHVSATLPPTIYTSQIASHAIDPSLASDKLTFPLPLKEDEVATILQQGTPGPEIQLGYEYGNETGNPFPSPVVKMRTSNELEWASITDNVAISTDKVTHNLMIQITNSATMAEGASVYGSSWPTGGTIEIAWDCNNFSGYMQPSQGQDATPSLYYWIGAIKAQQPAPSPILISDEKPLPLLANPTTLSIGELLTFYPDKDALNTLSNNMLIENMKWAIAEKPNNSWLPVFFGERQPVLDEERKAAVRKDLAFYQSKLSYAYLGHAIGNLTGAGAPAEPLNQDEAARIKEYLHTGLAREPGYNSQSNDINVRAFVSSCQRLQLYLNDKESNWAKQVYEVISSVAQINVTMNQVITGDFSVCNHHATLLTVLGGPTSDLASQYMKNFPVLGLFNITLENVDYSNCEDEFKSWLPDFINQYIQKYITLPNNPTGAEITKNKIAKELKEYIADAQKSEELVVALTKAIISSKGASWNAKVQDVIDNFATNFPKISLGINTIAGCIRMAAWGFGLFNAIIGLRNWKNIPDNQRATLVVSVIGFIHALTEGMPEFLSAVKLSFNKLCQMRDVLFGTSRYTCEQIEMVAPDYFPVSGEELRALFNEETSIIEVDGSLLDKFFKGGAKFLRWLGPAVTAALAVLNAYNFRMDIENGSSQEQQAFDGIIAVSGILETMCLVVEGLAAIITTSEVLAAMATIAGPAAPVLAVIGIVFALVEAFSPAPPPPSPTDDFMKDLRDNFLPNLPAPQPPQPKAIHRLSSNNVDSHRINTRNDLITFEHKQGTFSNQVVNIAALRQELTDLLSQIQQVRKEDENVVTVMSTLNQRLAQLTARLQASEHQMTAAPSSIPSSSLRRSSSFFSSNAQFDENKSTVIPLSASPYHKSQFELFGDPNNGEIRDDPRSYYEKKY